MSHSPPKSAYADPEYPVLPFSTLRLDVSRVAFVVADPQADFAGKPGAAFAAAPLNSLRLANALWSTVEALAARERAS